MVLVSLIVSYILLFLGCSIIVYTIETKIPEHYSIKKWWRKYIIGDDMEN